MEKSRNERFIALNRIISVISERHKIWYLFLSTESTPPNRALPLLRSGPYQQQARLPLPLGDPPLYNYPPFTSLAADMRTLRFLNQHR